MRSNLDINIHDELKLMLLCSEMLQELKLNASNSIIATVSSDYSACLGMWLRHSLSHKGEICDGVSIEVPYPDEKWDRYYNKQLKISIDHAHRNFKRKNIILVEAGVIKGGTFTHIVDFIKSNYPKFKITTVAMYENVHSKFKSDIVGSYYDDDNQDLTFWWERYNKHWKRK